MNRTNDCIVASMLGLATLLLCSAASAESAKQEIQEKLDGLKQERFESAKAFYEAVAAAYTGGSIDFDTRVTASQELFRAQLAIASSPEERLRAFTDRLKRSEDVEKMIEALYKVGARGGEAEIYHQAQLERTKAQIGLQREKLRQARRLESKKN